MYTAVNESHLGSGCRVHPHPRIQKLSLKLASTKYHPKPGPELQARDKTPVWDGDRAGPCCLGNYRRDTSQPRSLWVLTFQVAAGGGGKPFLRFATHQFQANLQHFHLLEFGFSCLVSLPTPVLFQASSRVIRSKS